MYHTDVNVNTALERSMERVKAVQAYGATGTTPTRWLAAALGLAVLAVAVVLVLPIL